MQTTQDNWRKGTDLRNDDGIYAWPHQSALAPGQEQEFFVSATTVLNMMAADFRFAEHRFAADYTAEIFSGFMAKMGQAVAGICDGLSTGGGISSREAAAQFARDHFDNALRTATVDCWDKDSRSMQPRLIVEAIMDKGWMSGAGPRGLNKRANRGSIVHDAVEAWVVATQSGYAPLDPEDPYLSDWVATAIFDSKFAIEVDDCIGFVRSALRWLMEHVKVPFLAEAPVFNRTYNYAGTVDLLATLNGHDGLWLLDFKSSSSMTPRAQHKIQLAAYKNAQFYGVKDSAGRGTGDLEPLPCADRIANVYVFPDKRKAAAGDYRTELREWQSGIETAFQSFVKLREVWQQEYIINAEIGNTATIVKPPKSSVTLTSSMLPRKRDGKKEAVAA